MKRFLQACHFLVLLFLALPASAQPPIAVIQAAKKATAFVMVEEAEGTSEGSAFCIDKSGKFITNSHVVEGLKPGGKVTLIIHAGEEDQAKLSAVVVKADPTHDLALLQTSSPPNVTPLTLGSISGLVETMPIVAFGYPFGSDLALNKGDYPSISVSTGHITSLRRTNGKLYSIQIDASLNEGNSGGPVLDPKGQVIGIVMAGIPGSGINLAIPVSRLELFLQAINIRLKSPAQLQADRLGEPQDFHIDLLNQPEGPAASVVFSITDGKEPVRTVRATTTDGQHYVAHIVPVQGHPSPTPDAVAYGILVSRNGKKVAEELGTLEISAGGHRSLPEPKPVPNPSSPVSPRPAVAGVLYDGFDYPAGMTFNGQNGGTGDWGSGWNEHGYGYTPSVVTDAGLTFPGLRSSGNAIRTTSNGPIGHARKFHVSPGKVGKTLYISYLVHPLNVTQPGHSGVYFELSYGGLSIGKGGGSGMYGIEHGGGGGRVDTVYPVVNDKTAFLVVRITFGEKNENDKIELFINPTPGKPLPDQADAVKTDQNTGEPSDFGLGTNAMVAFDEVRFGHTFAEVAPPR